MTKRIIMMAAACLAISTLVVGLSEAGARDLLVLFVNMTPDALSDDASKACVKQIEKVIASSIDGATVKRFGETKLRKLAGYPKKGDSFLSWTAKSLEKPKAPKDVYHETIDTVVLVDCRPKTKSIDVMISPPSGGLSRMKIRGLQITSKLTRWVGKSIRRRAWIGFSP